MATMNIPNIGPVDVPDFAMDSTLRDFINTLSSQQQETIPNQEIKPPFVENFSFNKFTFS